MAVRGRHGQKGTGALGLLLAIVFFAAAACAVLGRGEPSRLCLQLAGAGRPRLSRA